MADETIPAELWPHDGPAPKVAQVLGQVAGLLNDLGYSKTSSALEKEALKRTGLTQLDPASGLLALYATTSADSSDEASSNSDSAPAKPVESRTKRKRVATPSSSSSGSSSSSSSSSSSEDESSSSDESDARPAKRSKVEDTTTGASNSDSSSSDSDSDSDSESDSSSSESAADDSSSSDSSSSDDSSSESESDSEPAPPPVKVKKEKKDKTTTIAPVVPKVEPKDNGSQSSATLQGNSPEVEAAAAAEEEEGEEENMSSIHPDRLKQSQFAPTTRKEGAASAKKAVVPFSRIPANQKIDPRFSNEYVSYDYADKAYQDLVVTKGKGFTKEKNKKKRGSYRGGAIDLAPKGIKFDD